MVALVSTFAAGAITLDEAFDRVSQLPGAAVSDIPSNDALEGAFERGQIVMLLGQPTDACDAIVEEITDVDKTEMTIDGHQSTICQTTNDKGNTVVLVLTRTPMGPVVMIAEGNKEVVNALL